jgi:hypothetical protein
LTASLRRAQTHSRRKKSRIYRRNASSWSLRVAPLPASPHALLPGRLLLGRRVGAEAARAMLAVELDPRLAPRPGLSRPAKLIAGPQNGPKRSGA